MRLRSETTNPPRRLRCALCACHSQAASTPPALFFRVLALCSVSNCASSFIRYIMVLPKNQSRPLTNGTARNTPTSVAAWKTSVLSRSIHSRGRTLSSRLLQRNGQAPSNTLSRIGSLTASIRLWRSTRMMPARLCAPVTANAQMKPAAGLGRASSCLHLHVPQPSGARAKAVWYCGSRMAFRSRHASMAGP